MFKQIALMSIGFVALTVFIVDRHGLTGEVQRKEQIIQELTAVYAQAH